MGLFKDRLINNVIIYRIMKISNEYESLLASLPEDFFARFRTMKGLDDFAEFARRTGVAEARIGNLLNPFLEKQSLGRWQAIPF